MKNFVILDKDLKVINYIVAETKEDADVCIDKTIYTSIEQPEFSTVDIGFIFDQEKNDFYDPNLPVEDTEPI